MSTPTRSSQNVEAIRRLYAATGPPEGIAAVRDGSLPIDDFYTPDVLLENFENAPIGGPYHGHEGIRQWARDSFDVVEDGRLDLDDVIEVDDEHLVVVNTYRGRSVVMGMEVELRFSAVMRMQEGRVRHLRGFLDHDEALRVAREGLEPPPPPTEES